MNSLYWLVTITDRRSTDAFLALYAEFGVTVSLRTVGSGTAVQETLSTLGLERTEKAVLFAMITADTWPKLQKGASPPAAHRCARHRHRVHHPAQQHRRQAGAPVFDRTSDLHLRGGEHLERYPL